MCTHKYMHILSTYLILPLLRMVFQKEISKDSLRSYLPKLSLIFIMHTSLNVSIFLSQRSPVLDKEVLMVFQSSELKKKNGGA